MLHHIWVAFFFFPGHNPPQVQLCLRQQQRRAGQSTHWHFWESFALQKTGLAMPDPELGRQGLNPQGLWQGKPLWFICSSEKDEAAQENNWVMQEQILGGQGVWGKEEGDTKVLFPVTPSCHSLAKKKLGRTLRRERRFHSSWGWEKTSLPEHLIMGNSTGAGVLLRVLSKAELVDKFTVICRVWLMVLWFYWVLISTTLRGFTTRTAQGREEGEK